MSEKLKIIDEELIVFDLKKYLNGRVKPLGDEKFVTISTYDHPNWVRNFYLNEGHADRLQIRNI
jgi:hypothetical protein